MDTVDSSEKSKQTLTLSKAPSPPKGLLFAEQSP